MLTTIMEYHIVFYAMVVMGGLGILAKLIAHITLKRMIKEASNMNKSTHSLMKLVRAKFEHACMISDRVENVDAFVEKYIYEYRTVGMRLYTWRHMEKLMIWLYGLLATAGTSLTYLQDGIDETMLTYAIWGIAGVIVLFLLHIATDENYQLEAARTYMVDYLENVCAHRYAKAYGNGQLRRQKDSEEKNPVTEPEMDVPVPESDMPASPAALEEPQNEEIAAPVTEPDMILQEEPVMAAASEESDPAEAEESPAEEPQQNEAIIRQILEEFMA